MGAFGDAFDRARGNSRLGQALKREGIKRTKEFERIAAIPWRTMDGSIDVEGLSAMLRLPEADPKRCKGCDQCDPDRPGTMTLFPDQAYAIAEAHDTGGAFVGTDVSSGKSLMILLTILVVGAKRPLVLMPANTRPGFADMIRLMSRHWRMPDNIMIGSYEALSSVKGRDYLRDRMPDWCFCDEAHNLKDEETSRGLKFWRHFDEFPDTHLCCYSGSFLDRTIFACAHLMYLCLRGNTPLPYDRVNGRNVHDRELGTFSSAIDADIPDEDRYAIGELERFVPEGCTATGVERAQIAFGARLVHTPGVVFSTTPTSTRTIKLRELALEIPPEITEAFEDMRETWETPQGDSIRDAVALYRCVRQIAQGFCYRWVWPNGVINRPWLDARKHWHKYVRRSIAYSQGKYDSYKDVKTAVERWEIYALAKEYGTLTRAELTAFRASGEILDSWQWRNWCAIRNEYEPVTETVWISEYVVDRVDDWLSSGVGIAWVESTAMGEAIRRRGYRYYRGGESEINQETVSCAASIKAHKEGKNLQFAFYRSLVVDPMGRGKDWEQLIGRTDRKHQKSNVIYVDFFAHCREFRESFRSARLDAQLAQAPGSPQKLRRANIELLLTDEEAGLKPFGDDPLWKYNKPIERDD